MSSALYLTTKAGLHFTSQRRPDLQHTTHSKQPAAVLSSKIPNCKLGSDIKHKVAVSIPSDSIIIPLVKFGIRGRICITLTQCWWGRAGLHTRVYVCNGMYPDTHPHTHTHTHTSRTRARTHARTHAHTDTHTHCAVFFLLWDHYLLRNLVRFFLPSFFPLSGCLLSTSVAEREICTYISHHDVMWCAVVYLYTGYPTARFG